MDKLRAFVAHSFNEERDGNIVKTFLDYFASLKDIFGLECDHAERAEAKAISQKVRDKMDGKDLFIGIFTAKNSIIQQENLMTGMPIINYGKKYLFSTGSSDWMIQESGYALAKGMQLLFLVENGVDVNIGLQGDLEFVPFQRENPSACFKKINEILGSLSIKTLDTMSKPTSASAPDTKKNDIDQEIKEDNSESKETLQTQKLFAGYSSLRRLICEDKDIVNAEKKLNEIIIEFKSDLDFSPSFWKSQFCRFKFEAGFPEALGELKTMSEEQPDDLFSVNALGYAYKEYGQYSKAAEQFLKKSKIAKTTNNKFKSIGIAAECYALDDKFDIAYDINVREFLDNKLDMNSQYILYKNLSQVAKVHKNNNLFTVFAEKALEIYPTDYDLRFSLAHLYGDIDNNSNSLTHYKFLCDHNPNGTNWNNIGVEYDSLEIKGKSIESYYEAADKYGETLAMSNIAYRYIKEGFLKEANDILKIASSKDNHHENVESAAARVNEIRRNEEESATSYMKIAEPERMFRIRYAESYVSPLVTDVVGKWSSLHGEILLNVKGKVVYGEIEIKSKSGINALAAALGGVGGIPAPQDSIKKIIISGEIINRSINYQLLIKTTSLGATLLTSYGHESKYKGLMYISEDVQIIKVMEWAEGKHEITYYEMRKLP